MSDSGVRPGKYSAIALALAGEGYGKSYFQDMFWFSLRSTMSFAVSTVIGGRVLFLGLARF